MRRELANTAGARLVSSPAPEGLNTTSSYYSVYLMPDEEVEWHWVETPTGRYVNGYTIRKKSAIQGAP